MFSRSIFLVTRWYGFKVVKPTVLAKDFFTEERRISLVNKISKLRAKPVSSRVVDETKVDQSKRASVLVPLVTVDGEPRFGMKSCVTQVQLLIDQFNIFPL